MSRPEPPAPSPVRRAMSASEEAFRRAQLLMPGGVSSPVRAFGAVGGTPLFLSSGAGARVTDLDGKSYVDLMASWGPLILGHAHPAVVEAVSAAASRGTSFGAPTPGETDLVAMIVDALPSVEMVRLVSSGTEATMSALRLARAATGRDKVVKFAGCYHGHVDSLLVSAGSGVATLGLPDSPGVTRGTSSDTLIAAYNSPLDEILDDVSSQIAAVIVEPVAANMGVVPPAPGFLEGLRSFCDASGALLIFDEVVTGFRVGYSGAQGMFEIVPDLTILGKIVGGGLPVGAYGGRRDLMEMVAPSGPVYQAGTLSGNPISVAAGVAMLQELERTNPYPRLEQLGGAVQEGLQSIAKKLGLAATVQRVGSMFTLFFAEGPVTDLESARRSNTARFSRFFHGMLEEGVYWPPSQFEAALVGAAHSERDVDAILAAAARAFERIE